MSDVTIARPKAWTMMSGEVIAIKDMSTTHLKNTVNMVEKALDKHSDNLGVIVAYHALCDELDTRWIGRGKKIAPRLRAIDKFFEFVSDK